MEKVTVVKVGGAIVEDSEQLAQLLKDFAAIPGKKVLVHGGGRRATKVATALGIESKMVNGRRITDADMLEVVTMVYGGLVNKNLVAKLQANGVNALGLTGADMDVIHSHKRPLKDGIDFGFVGDVERANGKMLQTLLEEDITPVMAPLTHDGKGNILNTNADTIASETAKALAPYYDVTLIYSFEKKGVLSNPEDDDSVIPVITHADFERYKADGTVAFIVVVGRFYNAAQIHSLAQGIHLGHLRGAAVVACPQCHGHFQAEGGAAGDPQLHEAVHRVGAAGKEGQRHQGVQGKFTVEDVAQSVQQRREIMHAYIAEIAAEIRKFQPFPLFIGH